MYTEEESAAAAHHQWELEYQEQVLKKVAENKSSLKSMTYKKALKNQAPTELDKMV